MGAGGSCIGIQIILSIAKKEESGAAEFGRLLSLYDVNCISRGAWFSKHATAGSTFRECARIGRNRLPDQEAKLKEKNMKKWEVIRWDFNKLMNVSAKNVTVPPLTMQLVVDLDDSLYKAIAGDSRWVHLLVEKGQSKVLPAAGDMAKMIVAADQKAGKFDAKTAGIFSKDLSAAMEDKMKKAGDQMAKECQIFVEEYKKGNKELVRFQAKCGAKITFTAVVVGVTTAASVASHGALAPLGIVAIVKGGIVITQEIVKLAIDADGAAKIINGELIVLKKLMSEKIQNAKSKGATEVALNVISKALSIETPSIKNVDGHIEVHGKKILEMEKKSHELAPLLHQAMDKEEKYRKQVAAMKASIERSKLAKVEAKLDLSEKALESMTNRTFKIADAIGKAHERETKWKDAVDALKKGIPDWIKYVDVAIGMAMDISMAVADASGAAEQALAAIIAAENVITLELVDQV